ncbi:MAG: HAD family hydrolase [Synechococcales cyanobacterium T60_A2020_003]|nr:HAD family hydrolase [Synechococcales cyanobacterium T60_A2020_003]
MVTIRCKNVVFHDIQAILFDKDGTLADADQYLRQLAQRRLRLIDAQIPGTQDPLLMAFGVNGDRLDPAGLMAVGTRHENEIAAAAYIAETGRGWREAVAIAQSCFREADQSLPNKAAHTPLFDGALTLLHILHRADIRLGIISADSPDHVEEFAAFYQLTPLLSVQMGSTESLAKPNSAMIIQACAVMNVLPRHTLIIGDADSDIEMAIAASTAGCIVINRGSGLTPSLTNANAIIQDLSEIQVRY